MAEQYTAGPWVWTMDRSNQYTTLRQSGSGDVVADLQADISDYGLSVNPWVDVSEADAALICAAPALVEALRFYADQWIGVPYGDEQGGPAVGIEGRPTPKLLADEGKTARQALSQALGGE